MYLRFATLYFFLLVLAGNIAFAQPEVQPEPRKRQAPLNRLQLEQARWYYSLEEAMVEPEKVYKLSLVDAKMKQFPLEVLMFPNLQVLNLSGNRIDTIPGEIAHLANLQEINLMNNRLTSLPAQIGDLQNLEVLYLAKNRLVKFPNDMRGLQRLRYLDLSFNNLLAFEIEWIQRALPKCSIRF